MTESEKPRSTKVIARGLAERDDLPARMREAKVSALYDASVKNLLDEAASEIESLRHALDFRPSDEVMREAEIERWMGAILAGGAMPSGGNDETLRRVARGVRRAAETLVDANQEARSVANKRPLSTVDAALVEAYVAWVRMRAFHASSDVGRADIAAKEARRQATSYDPRARVAFERWCSVALGDLLALGDDETAETPIGARER